MLPCIFCTILGARGKKVKIGRRSRKWVAALASLRGRTASPFLEPKVDLYTYIVRISRHFELSDHTTTKAMKYGISKIALKLPVYLGYG